MCGRGNILSVGIVKQEASVHKLPVQVIFLVDLEKGDLKLHQNITRVLFEVMSDTALIEKLRRAESYEDLFIKFILWEGDDEFPPSSQILFSDNFAVSFAAEDLAVAGDIAINMMKAVERKLF